MFKNFKSEHAGSQVLLDKNMPWRVSKMLHGLLRVLGLTSATLLLYGCGRADAQLFTASIEVSHVVGDQPLKLDDGSASVSYKTASGDGYSVTRLRYYLSNFRLRRADGSWYQSPSDPKSSDGYFLVDAAVPASQSFQFIHAPAGDYSGVEFLIGVDDARNSAGTQTGTLDPARGMFWTWRTGYIFLSLEGQSPQSTADQHALTFHIGGSNGGTSLARTVFLPAGETPLHIRANIEPLIHLHADLAALFHSAHDIRVAETNTVMESSQGGELADNAASMFSIDHIHNLPRTAGHAT